MVRSGGWEILYVTEDSPIPQKFEAELDHIYDTENEEPRGVFKIPNDDGNRDLISNYLPVAFIFDDTFQFDGIVTAADSIGKFLKVTVQDETFVTLFEAEPLTGVFDGEPANEIMENFVLEGTGITLDSCPSTEMFFVCYKANRLDIAKFIAEALGLELVPGSNFYLSIQAREGSYKYIDSQAITVSRHGFDRANTAGKVIIRGVDTFGRHITGEYGSGSPVRTFNEDQPTDQPALEAMAAKKYNEYQGVSGAPISIRMDEVNRVNLTIGDYLSPYFPRYFLNGNSLKVVGITKKKTKAEIQLAVKQVTIDKSIAELRSWEKKGIYLPGCTSWSINLQGLVGLWHLNEGEGTVAKDSSPTSEPTDGTITDGHWEVFSATGLNMLTFDGSTQVNLTNKLTFQNCDFSIAAWFSPSSLAAGSRYIVLKFNQFSLIQVGTDGVLRLNIVDALGNGHDFDSNPGFIKVGGRIDAVATYDGNYVKLYKNGMLHKSWEFTAPGGGLYNSTSDVILGPSFEGVIAKPSLWYRSLLDQEVTELHFFPLNRVVAKGGSSEPEWILPPQASGVMAVVDGGTSTPPVITEDAFFSTTPAATEDINETPEVETTPGASQSISETPTQETLTPAISHIGSNSSTGNNTTSSTFSLPASWGAGDLAVFWWYTYANNKTFAKPAAVTQLQDVNNASYGHLFIGYRVLQAGDSTFAWTSSSIASSDVIWGVSVFRGQHASPIAAEGGPTGFSLSGSASVPSIIVNTNLSAVIIVFGKRNDYSSISAQQPFTLGGYNSSTAGNDASAGLAYVRAYKNVTFQPPSFLLGGGGTDGGYGYTLVIKPA
jgi:hypothetical protein